MGVAFGVWVFSIIMNSVLLSREQCVRDDVIMHQILPVVFVWCVVKTGSVSLSQL